jgi:hypothetical protein
MQVTIILTFVVVLDVHMLNCSLKIVPSLYADKFQFTPSFVLSVQGSNREQWSNIDTSPQMLMRYSGSIYPNDFGYLPCSLQVRAQTDTIVRYVTFPIIKGVNQKAVIDIFDSLGYCDFCNLQLNDFSWQNITESEIIEYYSRFQHLSEYLRYSDDLAWIIKLKLTPDEYADLNHRFRSGICCTDWFNDLDLSNYHTIDEWNQRISQFRDSGVVNFNFSLANQVPPEYFMQQWRLMQGTATGVDDFSISCMWAEKEVMDYCSLKIGLDVEECKKKLNEYYYLNIFRNITPEIGYDMLKMADSTLYKNAKPLAIIVSASDLSEGTFSEFYLSRALARSHRVIVTQPGTKARLLNVLSRIGFIDKADILVFAMHGAPTGLALGEESIGSSDVDVLAQIARFIKPEGTVLLSSCSTGQDSACVSVNGVWSFARTLSRYAPDAYVISAVNPSEGARIGYDSLSLEMKYSVHFQNTGQRVFKGGKIIVPDYLESSCQLPTFAIHTRPIPILIEPKNRALLSSLFAQRLELFDIKGRRIQVNQTGRNGFQTCASKPRLFPKSAIEKDFSGHIRLVFLNK